MQFDLTYVISRIIFQLGGHRWIKICCQRVFYTEIIFNPVFDCEVSHGYVKLESSAYCEFDKMKIFISLSNPGVKTLLLCFRLQCLIAQSCTIEML